MDLTDPNTRRSYGLPEKLPRRPAVPLTCKPPLRTQVPAVDPRDVEVEHDREAEPVEHTTTTATEAPRRASPPPSPSKSKAGQATRPNMLVVELDAASQTNGAAWFVGIQELKEGRAVLLNTSGLDEPTAQRAVDFLAGACIASGGSADRVGDDIFVFAPPTAPLSVVSSEAATSEAATRAAAKASSKAR